MPCNLYYSDTEFFTVPCECALDGKQSGFCGSILGTKEYALALSKLKNMYEKSSCHTLDRYNMEAQKVYFLENDYEKILEDAIKESFKVEHWPYVQDGTKEQKQVKGCFESMSRRSFLNIMLGAKNMLPVLGVSAVTALYSLY